MLRIYLDYASTTPLDPGVKRVMDAAPFGNPSSLHSSGQKASAALFAARRSVAKSLAIADPRGYERIIFTGSATEANNLALRGTLNAHRQFVNSKRIRYSLMRPRIAVSAVEHESVLETTRNLAREGAELVILPVDRKGIVKLSALRKALTPNTILVSVMYANNEVGAIQPIREIAEIIRQFREQSAKRLALSDTRGPWPLFHSDAAQAFQCLDCNPDKLGVDLLTLSAHKIYGPKGIGALYIRRPPLETSGHLASGHLASGYWLASIITGGGQEGGLRSGTENTAGIAGFAEAARLAVALRNKETKRMARLQKYFWRKLRAAIPRAALNGPSLASGLRLPNNLNVWFPNVPAQEFLVSLDLAGVAASSGSACASRTTEPSYVLRAMWYTKKRAGESIRFTLGRTITQRDIDAAVKVIKNVHRYGSF